MKKFGFEVMGRLPTEIQKQEIGISIAGIEQGYSQTEHVFLVRDEDQITVYDRKCDHNGGKLCLSADHAVCPFHGWRLALSSGEYQNVHIKKEPLDYVVEDGELRLTLSKEIPSLPQTSPPPDEQKLTVEFIEHACLIFRSSQFSFATDPWVVGPAFVSGWWVANATASDWEKSLNQVDFIYISHNHPDHLNVNTLSKVRKDMVFIVPAFQSESVRALLNSYGFYNLVEFQFGQYYRYKETSLNISILKSGDFRDDSGIYFTYGDFSFLSAVDSNDLNGGRLPVDITMLATSFAGGASGFPLCFDTVSEQNKKKMLSRNREALKATVRSTIEKVMPAFYLPYAGFFVERAERDAYVREHNIKNNVNDFSQMCEGVETLNINDSDRWHFNSNQLTSKDLMPRSPNQESPEQWIESNLKNLAVSDAQLERYFLNSDYKDKLILFLGLTKSDFSLTPRVFKVDFSSAQVNCEQLKNFNWQAEKEKRNEGLRYLYLRVREDAFSYLLLNALPWEDISIGFQCRVDRVPDGYNSTFWHYFTNYYIGEKVPSLLLEDA